MRTKPESDYAHAAGILDYNHETGVFTWKVDRNYKTRAGSVAGGISPLGYRLIRLNNELLLAHRIAFFLIHGYLPTNIDHINGNRADNRIINLREATPSQNQHNRGANTNNTSGVKGVYWHKPTQKWMAYICVNRKQINIGLFNSLDDAKAARLAAELKYHGEFAASVCRA